jgi:Flp pilus assembly protein TadB
LLNSFSLQCTSRDKRRQCCITTLKMAKNSENDNFLSPISDNLFAVPRNLVIYGPTMHISLLPRERDTFSGIKVQGPNCIGISCCCVVFVISVVEVKSRARVKMKVLLLVAVVVVAVNVILLFTLLHHCETLVFNRLQITGIDGGAKEEG